MSPRETNEALDDQRKQAVARKPRIEVRRFQGTAKHAEQLAHMRVAHLTDLHFGRVTPMAVQRRAVELTNEAKPDLVVITGDFVCHSQLYLDQLVETLGALQAPTIAVLGNHDYWSGAPEVARALKKADVEVLRNQHTVITLDHQRIQVVGLDDSYTGHCDREKALKGLRRDLPSLGLSHIAEEADALWHHGVPLVLAGHTHAGQVTLARLHELALGRIVGHKYVHGLYGKRAGAPLGAVYVGAGIGAAVMPLRIGERGRRELAIFELGADVHDFDEHHDEQVAHVGRKPSPELTQKRQDYVFKRELQREIREARKYLAELKKQGRGLSSPPPPPSETDDLSSPPAPPEGLDDLATLDGPARELPTFRDPER
ncbi:metallophosphoesterase [Sandaracinus amylolyticus]|uniref:Metallophosphoesterase n=1 Tax=Sandaracinus amylolyticus TaxID=927083 RepID=A0A0F6YJ26_9BACT|nr:metallophosphoesterase [Sandaracinus amylolyticus]AKF05753.1 metallophosphoesterase [Sandaracinus amylolyticus]